MAGFLQRLLPLFGAILVLSAFVVVVPIPAFWPIRLSARALVVVVITTFYLVTTQSRGLGGLQTFSLVLINLGSWGMLLLALIQMGLGVRTLRQASRHAIKWSIRLAHWGLGMTAICLSGYLLIIIPVMLFQSQWWQYVSPLFLLPLLPPTMGFLLIWATRSRAQPDVAPFQPLSERSSM